ncbi:unnamed protein product [Gongylonema pulchrum]|uniref:Phorbol-ester/DAG-type domain-containing protein n=1 Tax=Gongylonema pulchrum TaxID=637853 RepID=A0A183DM40_9BILA|nr:unnamed protein product [Gongylonema pulchrum]
MNDQGSEANARSSLEDLLKAMNKWPVKDASELEVDPSADPEPLSSSELNASLQTLLSEPDTSASDVGYSRNPVTVSSSTITDEQVRPSFHALFCLHCSICLKRLNFLSIQASSQSDLSLMCPDFLE